MAGFKGKGSKDMYKDSPKLSKGKDGKMSVNKGPTEAEKVATEDNGQVEGGPVTEEALPAPARHASERLALHSKHEGEHAAHDHAKHGDKKELHARHLAEHKAMHKKHEKEAAAGGAEQPAAGE